MGGLLLFQNNSASRTNIPLLKRQPPKSHCEGIRKGAIIYIQQPRWITALYFMLQYGFFNYQGFPGEFKKCPGMCA